MAAALGDTVHQLQVNPLEVVQRQQVFLMHFSPQITQSQLAMVVMAAPQGEIMEVLVMIPYFLRSQH